MKNNKKNIFSNGDEERKIDDILPSKESQMQSFLERMTSSASGIPEPQISTANISEAIQGKSVVKDEEKDRILGITDVGIIEFDDKIIKGITIATQNILKKFKQRVANGSVIYPNVMETLTYIEFTNAAFIETPEFIEVKEELNKVLKGMLESDNPKYIEAAREGILGFFEASENNIIRGKKHFGCGYAIQNAEEKEFLRADFIAEMVEDGVIDYDFLEMAGEIDKLDFELIDCLYKKTELFTPDQVARALITSGCFSSRENILEYYAMNDKRYFVNLATSKEIAEYIIEGKISPRDALKKIRIDDIKDFEPELLEEFLCVSNFPKGTEFIEYISSKTKNERFLSKKLLSKLDRERFLKVVLSEKVAKNAGNPYTSEDYINEYGKLKVEDIMKLESLGKIDGADLIKLTSFKSIKAQDPEEYSKMIDALENYYDLDTLEELLKVGKVNKKFAELYNDFLENGLTEEQRKTYFEKMNKKLSEKENSDEITTMLVQAGLNVGSNIEHEISEDFIAEQFLMDEISENDLMGFYENGLITLKTIRFLYSDPDLISKFEEGKIDYRVLNILENRADIIKKELKAGRITTKQLMDLYSKADGIEIEEFAEITEGYEFEDEVLAEFLSDEVSSRKVQALFNNYYISQDDLSILVARNIITKEEADEFAKQIATHEQYESIFSLDTRFIKLTRETEGESRGYGYHHTVIPGEHVPSRASQIKNDPELQELLLTQIGFDERTLTLQGTNNSLDGYRVYPSEDYGIMVFLKNDRPGNATYIMSLQQGMYFLNKIVRERRNQTGETELGVSLESDATKGELRETEHVKVKNASAGWGANIVSAMKKLSPEFKEKMKRPSDYRSSIEDITEEIRKDYQERKERD